MKTAIQFGAGNIGRGFIGMLLAQAGYHVIFGDVVEAVVDKINTDGTYTVHVMDVACKDVPINNISAINSTTPAIVDAIANEETEIITTAVGLVILPRIAPTIAQGIVKRREQGCTKALNIIACENAIRASSQLKEAVYKALSEEDQAYCDQ